MIELPFHNDFFSLVEPENKEEIVEHCLDPALELPKEDFEWGDECLSEKVHLKLTGFTELLKPYITEVLNKLFHSDIHLPTETPLLEVQGLDSYNVG